MDERKSWDKKKDSETVHLQWWQKVCQMKFQNSSNPINIFLDERKMLRQKNPKFLDSEILNFQWWEEVSKKNPKFLKSNR